MIVNASAGRARNASTATTVTKLTLTADDDTEARWLAMLNRMLLHGGTLRIDTGGESVVVEMPGDGLEATK